MNRRCILNAHLRDAEAELAEELAAPDRDDARVAELQEEVDARRSELAS